MSITRGKISNYEEKWKQIQRFCLFDDEFMTKCFEDNIEIQRDDKGAGVKRARYNSSLLDANILDVGEKFENLPETYVIFITEHDIFGKGKPLYQADRYVLQTGELLGDGAHIIYVNGECKDETNERKYKPLKKRAVTLQIISIR